MHREFCDLLIGVGEHDMSLGFAANTRLKNEHNSRSLMRQISWLPWDLAFWCHKEQHELPMLEDKEILRPQVYNLTDRKIPKKQTKTKRPCRTFPCDKANAEKTLARLALNGIAFFRSMVDNQFIKNMRAVCIACLALG